MNKQPQQKLHTYRTALIIIIGIGTCLLWFLLSHTYPTDLRINEVSFTNNDSNDWIEIYNPSLSSVSLKGYYLSDSSKSLTRFKIEEDILIPSHGFAVFFGENMETDSDSSLPFNVGNGETIYLVDRDGLSIIDRLTVVASENDSTTKSVGRFPDGSTETFTFSVSTQGGRNNKDEVGNTPIRQTEI